MRLRQGGEKHTRRRALLSALLVLPAVLSFARMVTPEPVIGAMTKPTIGRGVMPEAGSLHLNLGAAYWNHGQFDAAAREWEKALSISPESALLMNNLGLVHAAEAV